MTTSSTPGPAVRRAHPRSRGQPDRAADDRRRATARSAPCTWTRSGTRRGRRRSARPATRPTSRSLLRSRQLADYFAGPPDRLRPAAGPGRHRVPAQGLGRPAARSPTARRSRYGELAGRVGSPAASRAVGLANGKNPIAIVVPCHRVIGADGSLTGYGGGLDRKRFLLALERTRRPAGSDGRASPAAAGRADAAGLPGGHRSDSGAHCRVSRATSGRPGTVYVGRGNRGGRGGCRRWQRSTPPAGGVQQLRRTGR